MALLAVRRDSSAASSGSPPAGGDQSTCVTVAPARARSSAKPASPILTTASGAVMSRLEEGFAMALRRQRAGCGRRIVGREGGIDARAGLAGKALAPEHRFERAQADQHVLLAAVVAHGAD